MTQWLKVLLIRPKCLWYYWLHIFNTEKNKQFIKFIFLLFKFGLNILELCVPWVRVGNKWLKLHIAGTNILSTWNTQLQDWRGGGEGWPGILITSWHWKSPQIAPNPTSVLLQGFRWCLNGTLPSSDAPGAVIFASLRLRKLIQRYSVLNRSKEKIEN